MDHRSIISGERKDAIAVLLRGALAGLSVPYRAAVASRNRRFDKQPSEVRSCGVPVISVGNLTTGGTGKTPIVCYLAKWFQDRGTRVAIVSRGYGRGKQASNDEALELQWRLPEVPHVQDPDRVKAARSAVEKFKAELILMDDGFQHRRLHRDLNIVVVDATCPFGFGHLLPRGLLREPIGSLRRADLVILTRCDAVESVALDRMKAEIEEAKPGIPILRSNHRPTSLLLYPNREIPIAPANVAAVSAIGNPRAFEQALAKCRMKVVDHQRLPDHDPYSDQTVRELTQWVQMLGDKVERVVCTHKDLVKLQTTDLGGKQLAALLIQWTLVDDPAPLDQHLQKLRP